MGGDWNSFGMSNFIFCFDTTKNAFIFEKRKMEIINSLFPNSFETFEQFCLKVVADQNVNFIQKSFAFAIIRFRETYLTDPNAKQCRQLYLAHLMTDEELSFQNVSFLN